MATASAYALGLLTLSSFSFLLRSLDVERRFKRVFLRRVQAYLALEEDCSPTSDEKKELDGPSPSFAEEKPEWWKMGAGSISKLNKLDPLNTSLLPGDRFRLLLQINLITFLFSLAGFGSLLPFAPRSDGGCRFFAAFAVLAFQLIHPITYLKLFLHLSTLSAKFYIKLLESPSTITLPFPRVGMIEQIVVYTFLLLRIGASVATSAVNSGHVTVDSACLIAIQPVTGSINLGMDITFILYLTVRQLWILWIAKALGLRIGAHGEIIFDEIFKTSCFGRWLIGHVLDRFAAETGTALVVILSGAAQWIRSTGIREFWVPQALALILFLQAVNVPLLRNAPSAPAPFPTTRMVGQAGGDEKRKPSLGNFIPGYTRRPSRSTTQLLSSGSLKQADVPTAIENYRGSTSEDLPPPPPIAALPTNSAAARSSQDSSFMAAMATPLVFRPGSIRTSRTPGGSLSSVADSTRQLPVNSRPLPPPAEGDKPQSGNSRFGRAIGLPGSVKIRGLGTSGVLPMYRQEEVAKDPSKSMRGAVDRVRQIGRVVSGFKKNSPIQDHPPSYGESNYRGPVSSHDALPQEVIQIGKGLAGAASHIASRELVRPLPREPRQSRTLPQNPSTKLQPSAMTEIAERTAQSALTTMVANESSIQPNNLLSNSSGPKALSGVVSSSKSSGDTPRMSVDALSSRSSGAEQESMNLPFLLPLSSPSTPLDLGSHLRARASVSETPTAPSAPRQTPQMMSRPIPSVPATPRDSADVRRSVNVAREKRLMVETNLKMASDAKREKVQAVNGALEDDP